MEIEKTRETSWKIQLKNKNENIEITSVEISGEVRIIKLALLNSEKSIRVEMNKEEFFNFLSLISAFKDVLIGDESIVRNDNLNLIEKDSSQVQEPPSLDDDLYQINTKHHKENLENNENEELNPEEWDPW
ncbi:hypothetical protein LCGC14_2684600 [marine sediment metagenome]|uniref:Uncharacterized protein n=1 Tax=marine sediment metagenome TaxID=412755 RepID=A0A0F9BV13_9ZZZZ